MLFSGKFGLQCLKHHAILDLGPIGTKITVLTAQHEGCSRLWVRPDLLLVIRLCGELHRLEVMLRGWPYLPIKGNRRRVKIAKLSILVLRSIEQDGFLLTLLLSLRGLRHLLLFFLIL